MIEILTWVLVGLSLIGVVLNIKRRTECFAIWLITNSSWMVYDFYIGASAQGTLFLMYAVLAVYGLYEWGKGKGKATVNESGDI